jgi:Ca-activated chloride channel family protein
MSVNFIRLGQLLLLSGSLGLAQIDGPITPRLNPRLHPGVNARLAPEPIPAADLRVDVPLVLIPVHVTTPLGVSVTDLNKESFRLFEDGAEQQITHFASEDAPLSIGVLFDASGSMKNKIAKSAEAVAAFFKTSNAEDEFFLIEFNERARLAVPFTQDSDEIYKHVARTRALGRTSLLDAIHLGLAQMKNARNLRKALVIVSDGGDNRSRYTESEVKAAMREADVQVYALGIFDPDDQPKRTREEKDGPRLLGELADETGGRHYPVETLDKLPELCARIGNELRNQYLLGYSPSNGADDGKYRHVKVTMIPPEGMPHLRAHHRQGYYASSGQ